MNPLGGFSLWLPVSGASVLVHCEAEPPDRELYMCEQAKSLTHLMVNGEAEKRREKRSALQRHSLVSFSQANSQLSIHL